MNSESELDLDFAGLIADFVELIEQDHLRADGQALSILQMRLLSSVYFCSEAPSMSQLASALNIAMPSVTVVADKLETDGYMLRKNKAVDRRIIQAHLTDKGRTIVEQKLQILQTIMVEATEGFSIEDMETVRHFFQRFVSAARKL